MKIIQSSGKPIGSAACTLLLRQWRWLSMMSKAKTDPQPVQTLSCDRELLQLLTALSRDSDVEYSRYTLGSEHLE